MDAVETLSSLQRLNLAGIHLLVQGNVKASLDVFNRALQVARLGCSKNRAAWQGCSSGCYKIGIFHLQDTLGSAIYSTSEPALANDFHVYEGVFAVARPQDSNNRSSSDKCEDFDDVDVLVVLYNLGYALHNAGLVGEKRGDKTLAKALHLYKMANECARHIPLDDHPELSTLLLALTTNQGHIHSCFFQQHEVHHAHEIIEGFLAAASPSALLREDFCFFESVALFSAFAKAKLPPAA